MCKSQNLASVLDLGYHPPSDSFLTKAHLYQPETNYPLRLVNCIDCGLLQIDYFVDPKILYQDDYPYESTMTKTGYVHYHKMADDLCKEFGLVEDSLVVDIGSNDGLLLTGFQKSGMRVLGVDPAKRIAEKAIARGVNTIIDFFGDKVAREVKSRYGCAKVITGTNVFAHLHDLDSAVAGMKILLDDDGVIVIEAPYARELIDNLEYDTIYHEHIGYLSVKPMRVYFNRFGLELFDVRRQSIHGGSLRYFVGHAGRHPVTANVDGFVSEEGSFGLYSHEKLRNFAGRVLSHKKNLIDLLLNLKKQGKKIVGISAPAKGNTLLNYCHIDHTFLDFITEKSSLKIGRFTPGTHLPIYPDEMLVAEKADYGLILAWNFAEEIMRNLSEFRNMGGRFIIPVPEPRIV